MNPISLHEWHHNLGARFGALNGMEVVSHYGDVPAEHNALRRSAGVLDLGFRGRLCLAGTDRARFLHGQVTNDVKRLRAGEGCYAALTTAKGKMVSDVNVLALEEELLLDFEPGLARLITERLEKYIVADDVQVLDAAPHYGLLTVQGPKAADIVRAVGWFSVVPAKSFDSVKVAEPILGELLVVNQPRLDVSAGLPALEGFDVFVPTHALAAVADKLIAAAKSVGGRACGWDAFEMARIEAGIPRFGADMDETNIPLECGIEARAVSYDKGCYIGQEVINRIHSIGHVNRELRGLRLGDDPAIFPTRGDKLFKDDREVGQITSAIYSLGLKANIALGYVRREGFQPGTELQVGSAAAGVRARVVALPFKRADKSLVS